MNKYLDNKRTSLILLLVCFATYTIIGFTRNAYTAAIAGIIEEGYFTKFDAGTIASSFNITYCISQIIGSYFVDKVSPFKIILIGVVATLFANIAMSLYPTYTVIFISRAVCGIAQFGIWPALLKIVTQYTHEDYRRKWLYIMPLGITSGSVISYLAAGMVGNWRSMFVLSYVFTAICMVAFMAAAAYTNKKATGISPDKQSQNSKTSSSEGKQLNSFKLFATSGMLFMFVPVIMKSLIGTGISSWMPTLIMESYNVSSGISNTMTAISTCANFAAVLWVVLLYPKAFKLQTTAVGMFNLFMVPLLIVSCSIGKIPLMLIVVLITLTNTFINSIHQFFTVEMPSVYTKYNKSGMIAGIINAIGTFAGILGNIIYGYMAEKFDWNIIIASWAIMAFLAMAFSFVATPSWKKFIKK